MSPSARELFDQGRHHFDGKNYPKAEQCFLKLLRSGARYADVHNMLGVIYHVEGKFNNAIESFEEALRLNPNYTEAALNLAVLYNDLGEYKKAKGLYGDLRKRLPPSDLDPILKGKIANLHAQLADIYRGVGRYQEAIDEYKKALQIGPSFADIRTKLGIAYRENNQKDLAVKELNTAIAKNTSFKNAHIQLGITLYSMGRKDQAARAWRALLKRDKENDLARMYLRLCEDGNKRKVK